MDVDARRRDEIWSVEELGDTSLEVVSDELLGDDEDRPTKLKKSYLVHATTEDKLQSIREHGLLPRGLAGCKIWGEERIPYGVSGEEMYQILDCRENQIYFWDDIHEVTAQGLATVAYLKEGDPAIVIVKDLDETKMQLDLEVHRYGEPDPVEPTAYMYNEEIPPNKIMCTCTLREDLKPDTGKVACPMMHNQEDCPDYTIEYLIEEYSYPDHWDCNCNQ